ncbi:hypothetical protein EC988_002355 [Linderina pennispora]|nr:hypothetical protein EC988_002355 [Linderina pennispora]
MQSDASTESGDSGSGHASPVADTAPRLPGSPGRGGSGRAATGENGFLAAIGAESGRQAGGRSMDRQDGGTCPICLQTIQEAFMAVCGHSFCYRCISRHLTERRMCPTCLQPLERDQIFPNFTLNQVIADAGSLVQSPLHRASDILQQLRSSVENGSPLDPDDVDALLAVLQQKKQSLRSYERQFEMATMRQFLLAARGRKVASMEVLRKQLLIVEEDLDHVTAQLESAAPTGEGSARFLQQRSGTQGDASGVPVPNAVTADDGSLIPDAPRRDADSAEPASSKAGAGESARPKNRRVEEHYEDLEAFYFDSRMRGAGGDESLDEFLDTLTTFARYERFEPVATLRYGDSTANTAIVASIEFDKDDELFAVAGVTRKIKIYDYNNVISQADTWTDLAQTAQQRQRQRQRQRQLQRQRMAHGGRQEWWHREGDAADEPAFVPTAMQYPSVEFTNRSKISCLAFNPYIKAQLACSDYDGAVTLWDVGSSVPTLSLDEHEKRAWSVDFSRTDPTRLCSGSDDGKVKVWATNRRASVLTIEGKANVCCVRFNPLHGNILSFGSADHNVHCFDLRSPKQPLCVLRGHRKAVSYTRFLSPDEIVSASTDSSLKLWSLRSQECVRTFTGHANEKNFVGLTTSGGEWISCGSENNTMYSYYRNLSKPAVVYKFGNCNPVTGVEQPEDDPSLFVSAVCWKNRSNTVLSANSQGIIKVLELA